MNLQVLPGAFRGLFCVLIVGGGLVCAPRVAASRQHQAAGASNSDGIPVKDPKAWFARGQAALQAGDLDSAETDFRKVAAADPTSGAAYANLGVIAVRRKQWDQALALLQKAEKFDPKMTGIRLNIGLVRYDRGDYAAAIKPVFAVVGHETDFQHARYLLALCNVVCLHFAHLVALH